MRWCGAGTRDHYRCDFGDTGGAAIEAFRGREAVDVFILFPDGRVSDVQKQMTTPQDANVHTLSVDGTFDDCRALVKGMFNDAPFRSGWLWPVSIP